MYSTTVNHDLMANNFPKIETNTDKFALKDNENIILLG